MKKVLKNFLKWLAFVIISFSVIFTVIFSMEEWGIIEAISYKISTADGPAVYNMESSELEEYCKGYQEISDNAFEEYNNKERYIDDDLNRKILEINELYKKYPVGITTLYRYFAMEETISDLYIISLVMGIVVGTAIYLMLDKDKKGLKVIIAIYILFVLALGFVEGIGSVVGEDLTLLDRWMFPETYIIPVTAIFALAILVRVIRQKDIAKKLNKKLEDRKEEKNK